MRINTEETILLTEQEKNFFYKMIGFIGEIYEESDHDGSIEDITETIIDLLCELDSYIEKEE